MVDYVYTIDDKVSELVLGNGSMYNSSKDNNVDYRYCDDRCTEYITNKDVQNGEELLVNYGEDYWSSRKN